MPYNHSMRDPAAFKTGTVQTVLTQYREGLEVTAYMFDTTVPTIVTEFEDDPRYGVMYEIKDGVILEYVDLGV